MHCRVVLAKHHWESARTKNKHIPFDMSKTSRHPTSNLCPRCLRILLIFVTRNIQEWVNVGFSMLIFSYEFDDPYCWVKARQQSLQLFFQVVLSCFIILSKGVSSFETNPFSKLEESCWRLLLQNTHLTNYKCANQVTAQVLQVLHTHCAQWVLSYAVGKSPHFLPKGGLQVWLAQRSS